VIVLIKKEFVIRSESGLHARPASMLVKEASKFKSTINIEYDNKKVDAKSILGVMSLGIQKSAVVNIIANGEDENDAMSAIEKLIDSNFGE
jgi:phosphocarrier protein